MIDITRGVPSRPGRRRRPRPSTVAIAACLAAMAACESVTVPATDETAPTVKMDIYGVDEPDAQFLGLDDCCTLRRTVGLNDSLTIVASAEDVESGVQVVEIVATALTECTVSRTFAGNSKVPDGPPLGQTALRQTERILASSADPAAAGGSAPATRLVNGTTRLAEFVPEACGPVRVFVNDDPPTSVVVGEQSTTFCGVRFFVRGQNGTGATHSTATALLVEGPPRSGSLPCRSVPF